MSTEDGKIYPLSMVDSGVSFTKWKQLVKINRMVKASSALDTIRFFVSIEERVAVSFHHGAIGQLNSLLISLRSIF